MHWDDLLTALALLLVLEGILPFIHPSGFKRYMARASRLENAVLRRVGIAGMAAGVALLYFVR